MRLMKEKVVNIFAGIFGRNIALEHMIFILVALSGIFMSTVGLVGNSSLGLNAVSLLVPSLNIVIDIACIAYSIATKRWRGTSVIVVFYAIFVLFPFLWFSTGGATGSTMPFVIMSGLVVVIIFQGKFRAILSCVTVLMFCTFIYLEMLYPDIFVPYPNREAWYIDLIIGLISSFTVSVTLVFIVLARYKRAKFEAENMAKKLEEMALTDPLTGVYNRRFLTSCLDEEMRKAYDSGQPLTVCILDIDHFKRINDSYGHVYGDEVLIKLAQLIGSCLGEDEVFGRYGGEEFLILFKGNDVEGALWKISLCTKKLRETRWAHGGSITVSCGVGAYTKGISYSSFVESADINLYKAKEGGRNRVVS